MTDDASAHPEPAAMHPDFDLVASSPLFDAACLYPDRTRRDAAIAYLDGVTPSASPASALFDPFFYDGAYPDVAAAGLNGLVHYVRFGRTEGRLPARAVLRDLAAECRTAGLTVASGDWRVPVDGSLADLTGIEADLLHRLSRGGHMAGFDPAFYVHHYLPGSAAPIDALAAYLRVGRFRGDYATPVALDEDAHVIAPAMDVLHYAGLTGLEPDPLACARHYLVRGSRDGIAPAPGFAPDYYRRNNPDIARRRTEPFVHYVMHGRAEGRVGRPDFGGMYRGGGMPSRADRPTLVVAVHEASVTGAPLVALALALALHDRYDIIFHVPHDLGLLDALVDAAIFVVVGRLNPLDNEYLLRELRTHHAIVAVLANSAETLPLVTAALSAGIPTVTLVHEFSEYSKPAGKVADVVLASDRAIVPVPLIAASAQRDVGRHLGGAANTIRIRAQGRLPSRTPPISSRDLTAAQILSRIGRTTMPRIVLGAGYFQIRKGLDFFVQTAAETRRRHADRDIVFLWVGAGYHPDREMGYAFWIGEDIARFDLKRHLFVLDQQDSLDTLFALADIFYLSSRLDPFPNVALDAMGAGKPVVCFDHGTGITDLIGPDRAAGTVVPYGDAVQASDAIVAAFDRTADAADRNPAFIDTRFRFTDYADFVAATLEEAIRHRAVQRDAEDRIAASGLFDAAFHDADPLAGSSPAPVIARHVAATQKGMTGRNPRPGFSNDLFRAQMPRDAIDGVCPLLAAIQSRTDDRAPVTHVARRSSGSHGGGRIPAGGIGLHLHLADPRAARALLGHIDGIQAPIALYVTVATEQDRILVAAIALDLARPLAGLTVAPPCPLLALAITLDRYPDIQRLALFGHAHDLGTDLETGFGTHADFLHFEALLGLPHALEIFDHFAVDSALGLVFVEDPRASGWATCRPFAEAAITTMSLRFPIPDLVHAAVGGMFWARPVAIRPIAALAAGKTTIDQESAIHRRGRAEAVHRLLPDMAQAAGLRWETTYVSSESAPWTSGTTAGVSDPTLLRRGQYLHPPIA